MQKSILMENRRRVLIPADSDPKNDKEATVLSELLAMTSTTEERRAGHWIPVHSDYWRRVLGGGYSRTIRQAIERGLVEVNGRYSVGRFSKSYRLPKRLRSPDCVEWPLRRGTAPTARIRIGVDDTVGQRLVTHFEAFSVPVMDCSEWASYSVRQCHAGNHYAIRCQYGRLHTTFTSLPKEIRSGLTFENTPTVEIDVSNCQPLIIGIHAAEKHQPHPQPHPYHMLHSFNGLDGYLALCQEGRLYDWLLERSTDRTLKRADIKRQFLVMAFADTETTKRLPIFALVTREFPAVARYLLEAKREQYQDLARSCQRFESGLMVDQVAGSLEWPVLTIHDSIVAPVDRATETKHAIISAWRRYGVEVTVRTREQPATPESPGTAQAH